MIFPAGLKARHLPSFAVLVAAACSAGCAGERADERAVPALLPEPQRRAARNLAFDGAHNFRDLGGYLTSDGKRVKWGVLYRSDALGDLSDEDLRYFERLGIRKVVDLRSQIEREENPDRLPPGVAVRLLPIEVAGTDVGGEIRRAFADPGLMEQLNFESFLVDANRSFVSDFTPVYRQWLSELAVQPLSPTLVHCTAGKDRAGFASALVLLALGVPRETVMEDYLLSNRYGAEHVERQLRRIRWGSLWRIDEQKVRPLLTVRESYLKAAFEEMERRYGSVENYLREALGVDSQLRAALREALLES